MAKLKVEITALRANKAALEQQINELEAMNTRLETLISRMESSWEGEASDAYIRVVRSYAAQAANMVKVLVEYKSYIDKTANTFETKDKNLSSRIFGAF